MTNPSNIRKLITNNSRRLQVLKEKKALKGYDVEADVILEIEDIEKNLEQLNTQLSTIESEAIHSSQQGKFDPNMLEKQLSQMEKMEVELKSLRKHLKKLEKKTGTSKKQDVNVTSTVTGDNNQVYVAGGDINKS